ncbi:MAG: glycerophosphodiester phosphodiesterase family protein [Gammaproteobacteria bacterium]|nr:glycerophosphodiester phosphodiesterase family protein [Gammaproteobacteria bacterium]
MPPARPAPVAGPELIAHRGYPARYPENTLPGLAAALDAGARWLEFDVQLTLDRVPVLLHDATLQRTAGRAGDALALPAAALARVAVGETARLGPAHAGVTVPTLAEALALLDRTPGVTAFVELKGESIARHGVAACLDALAPQLEAARGAWVLIGFDADMLAAAGARGWRRGWVLDRAGAAARARAEALRPEWLFVDRRKLRADRDLPWPGPWQWAAYVANSSRTALALGARGFGYVETDDIGGLLDGRAHTANDA